MKTTHKMGTGIGRYNLILDGITITPYGHEFCFKSANKNEAKKLCSEKEWEYLGVTNDPRYFWAKSPHYKCIRYSSGDLHSDGVQVIEITTL